MTSNRPTPQQAVLRGHLMVNLPVCSIIFGGSALSLRIHSYLGVLGALLSIATAWLWWSLFVPLWRTWLQTSGAPIEETLSLAVKQGLIWPKGSFFERTELPILRPPSENL
jgi:hypothetical protein